MSQRLPRIMAQLPLGSAMSAALVAVILVGGGREIAHGQTTRVFALLVVAGVCALGAAHRGVFIGVLLLAALNGLPFVDTSRLVATHISEQDVACLALIGAGLAWIAAAGAGTRSTRIARNLSWCGFALLVWCVFTIGRTWVDGDASVLAALRYGRDFVYFGVLLIVLPRVRLSPREIKALLAVLIVGVCVFSFGQILTIESIANPTYLVHSSATSETLGFTRVFAPMNDLIFAGVAMGIAAVALFRGGPMWRATIPITLLLTVSLVLELTRARWIALVAAIVASSLWLVLQAERRTARIARRRLGLMLGSLCTVGVGLSTFAPSVISAGPIARRMVSIFTDVQTSAFTTLSYRQRVSDAMFLVLGGKWPGGVGLIPPSAHYYATLPNGELRNADLGVLNALMTIGAVGAVLIYLPLIVVLIFVMRRMRTGGYAGYSWLSYGGQIWIVASLASSVTLVTLFSVSGLVMSTVILMVLCQPSIYEAVAPEGEDLQARGSRRARGRIVKLWPLGERAAPSVGPRTPP